VRLRSDEGAVDIVQGAGALALAIGLRRESLKDAPDDTRLLPAAEAAGHCPPETLARRQISPRGSRAQDPPHASEEGAMVRGGSPRRWFLGWEPGLEPLPWLRRQVSSVHTPSYIAQNQCGECAPASVWKDPAAVLLDSPLL
jgi:hypothetical protein